MRNQDDLNDVFAQADEPAMPAIPMPTAGDVGWLLLGSGAFGLMINLLRERRGLIDLAVPLGLIGAGAGVLLQRRRGNMETAEQNILAELDALDPVARAQVLKAVAKDELGRLPGVGS